jgi:FkbH-like protein
MAKPETAAKLKAWNARWEPVAKVLQKMFGWLPVAYGRGPYGVFRSLRWRKAKRAAEFKETPFRWIVEATAKEKVSLLLEISSPRSRWTLDVGPDTSGKIEVALPPVEEGTLFSIKLLDSNDECEVRFLRNEMVGDDMVKCVAWDLDGTLWQGTLSEGDDVKLTTEAIKAVKALDACGVVNSLCSKNDEDVAIAKLKELGVEELFVFPQINWGPKSESLRRLAEEMNIGLDAMAFVDDREENRAEVRDRLPQVRVIAETEIGQLVGSVKHQAPGLGCERRKMYREEMVRRKAVKDFEGDESAFYEASGLDVELLSVEGGRKTRCLELLQRTNQLNLTARRYDEREFDELVGATECRAVRVCDKYGDYGVVGFVAWQGTHLVECCFSCRVAKRGVERKVLDQVSAGRHFTADIVETERNGEIRRIVREWLDA